MVETRWVLAVLMNGDFVLYLLDVVSYEMGEVSRALLMEYVAGIVDDASDAVD